MATSVSLTESALAVEPGQSVTTRLRVRNTGDVVDQFVFQPLGDAAPWISVEPAMVRLFPDGDQEVTVTIAPPREPTTTPGLTSWAVKAVPQEDALGAAVAEGTVDVGTFVEFGAELQPLTGRGRLSGRFDIAVDNRGNVPLPVRVSGTDAAQSLDFDVRPALLETQPGQAHFAKLRIKPDQRIWKGQPKTHPFEVLIESYAAPVPSPESEGEATTHDDAADPTSTGDTASRETTRETAIETAPGAVALAAPPVPVAPITISGTLLQEPVIPKWLWKAVLIAFAALIALWILWQTVLKPNIESAARDIAIEEVEAVEEQVAAVEEEVEAQGEEVADVAAEVAEVAEEVDAGGGGSGGADDGGGGGLGNVFNETTQPSNIRLALSAAVGGTDAATASDVGPNQSYAITDMVLQNPDGDLGTIEISIGGATVIESSLGNFRTLDFHYVAPYIVTSDAPLEISVNCTGETSVPADNVCDPAVSFSGFMTTQTEEPAGG